jgi:hypothetical protein
MDAEGKGHVMQVVALIEVFLTEAKGLTDPQKVKSFRDSINSQTCIKRSPVGQRKSGLLRRVTF